MAYSDPPLILLTISILSCYVMKLLTRKAAEMEGIKNFYKQVHLTKDEGENIDQLVEIINQ
ncbi:hypothetical protein [Bacillus litorisediminis]|uniref:hypothetical protein n=1 Tax=Bacillus litorisediminis TaxID=2922713 RepID=UPI001FB03101|nr:hypothetical protein [Bacillus litorisediminis]